MQKIFILGADTIGAVTARELSALLHTREYDAVCIHNPIPVGEKQRDAIGLSHSFDGTYYPSSDELSFLNRLERQAEWDDIVKHSPPQIQAGEREAKAADWAARQPKHRGSKSFNPSTKARKAARRRAKAGRKAAR